MAHWFDTPIGGGTLALLVMALVFAAGFEFVNGFHDTANAVATVIYTNTLKPAVAVLVSGAFNFLGCYVGGIAVALAILKLLPVELLASSGGTGIAMVLALLMSAILWNLGTWYFGLPASSSHTLIGAIVGVGLANSLTPGHVFGSGVNWVKVHEIGLSLLLSPLFGITAAALLLLLARAVLKSHALHSPPVGGKPPPWWIRTILVGTCSGVSFAHGSNDGQKGVGLIMLILIGLLPADFALNPAFQKKQMDDTVAVTQALDHTARETFGADQRLASTKDFAVPEPQAQASRVLGDLAEIRTAFAGRSTVRDIPADNRFEIRSKILSVDHTLADLEKSSGAGVSSATLANLHAARKQLRGAVDFAPLWVKILIALSLGVGTMIGWRRIVVTVGEKIGKSHLTYSQGASAELVAAATIGMSAWFGLPVSTTHVLSSGIAGTMVAQKSGLQKSTVRNIALAWVLTLPVAMVLAAGLFLIFRALIPDAHAASTPTVRFQSGTEDATVVLAKSRGPLRLHGSNTIGAELAPALAESFLRGRGATDVTRARAQGGHTWVVTGRPSNADPVVVEIDAEGTGTGFQDLARGGCDVGLASRAVGDDEAKAIAAAGFGDPTSPANEFVVGLDGIAIVTAPGNPVASLSTDDLRRIFSGETSTWRGGAGGPIHVYARDDRSGTWDTFRMLVLGDRPLASGAVRFADSAKLADAVAVDPGGIGFVGMAVVRGAHAVPVSDSNAPPFTPTRFSVATEDYPLSRRLFLYLPSPRSHGLAQDFVNFALSPQGQLVVAARGFVDVGAGVPEKDATVACTSCPAGYLAATQRAKRLPIDFRFRAGSTDLDSRALQDSDRLATLLHGYRGAEIELLGFSDNAGTDDANVAISRDRAKSVAERLAAYGLQARTIDGFGAQLPVASNDTPAGRERNRRVEVWLVADTVAPRQ